MSCLAGLPSVEACLVTPFNLYRENNKLEIERRERYLTFLPYWISRNDCIHTAGQDNSSYNWWRGAGDNYGVGLDVPVI